jgi:hypothetical protein
MRMADILKAYDNLFENNPGIPWGGFKNNDEQLAYWETLQECIRTKTPLTNEQKNRFFPDFEDGVVY